MKIKLLCFGISKDILGGSELAMDVQSVSIKELKNELCSKYPEFERLSSLRFAVNESYQEDDFALSEGLQVAIIPPVSGG